MIHSINTYGHSDYIHAIDDSLPIFIGAVPFQLERCLHTEKAEKANKQKKIIPTAA